jgi:hypothetical protein
MRSAALLSLAVLVAVLALPMATAQPPTYTESFQVRAAVGDIPSTAAVEPSNAWNVEQRVLVAAGNATQAVTLQLPFGSSLVNASCTCGGQPTVNGRDVTFQVSGNGTQTVTMLTSQPSSRAFGFEVMRPAGPGDGVVILYVPSGYDFEAPVEPTQRLPSTSGTSTIVEFRSASLPNPFWASLHVATTAVDDGADSDPSFRDEPLYSDGIVWIFLAAGVLVGIVLWAFLVSRGAVQAKGRKQVVSTAAHVEAAANEPPAVLEGRKRALLAALKEIEVAKMNNEMPNEVYDVVKADLKKQAVTVMRALETATAAGEAKA